MMIMNKYKKLIIKNSKLKENNNNDNNYIKKEIKRNPMKRERAEGLEDYLLDKIFNNQRQVLGGKSPFFYENTNMPRSMNIRMKKRTI